MQKSAQLNSSADGRPQRLIPRNWRLHLPRPNRTKSWKKSGSASRAVAPGVPPVRAFDAALVLRVGGGAPRAHERQSNLYTDYCVRKWQNEAKAIRLSCQPLLPNRCQADQPPGGERQSGRPARLSTSSRRRSPQENNRKPHVSDRAAFFFLCGREARRSSPGQAPPRLRAHARPHELVYAPVGIGRRKFVTGLSSSGCVYGWWLVRARSVAFLSGAVA